MYGFVSQVSCVGQVIGAIAAETQAQAQRAAKMVKVTYKDLPRILTIEVGGNFNIVGKFCLQFCVTSPPSSNFWDSAPEAQKNKL